MIIDRRQRPPRLLRRRRQTPEETRNPEAHAAFVGPRGPRPPNHGAEKCRREDSHKGASRGGRLFHVRPLRLYRYPAAVTSAFTTAATCARHCECQRRDVGLRKKLKFRLP